MPNQIVPHGKTSNYFLFSTYMRLGQPSPGTPVIDWRIHGETGEVRITSPTPFLLIVQLETKLELRDRKTSKVEVVEPGIYELGHLSLPARSIGTLYELFVRLRSRVMASSMQSDGIGLWKSCMVGTMGKHGLRPDCCHGIDRAMLR